MSGTGKQSSANRARRARGGSIELDVDGLGDFVSEFWSRDRVYAMVGVACSLDGAGPVLAPRQIKTIVEPSVRVYVVPDSLLNALGREVGSRVALKPGAVRIWWPGVTRRSDLGDHPLVLPLESESPEDVLAEFARQFHLSRPDVRREIRQIEDARALAEHRLKEAATAGAELESVQRQLRAARRLAGGGRHLGLRALRGDAAEQASILRAFGGNLAAFRASAGLTQVELSTRCFIRAEQVSELERGERVADLPILLVLAQALGVSVADLTEGLPPLTRQAGRERMRALIVKTPRAQRHGTQLAQASGLPQPYASGLLKYMAAYGEIVNEDHGYELATQPSGTRR